MADFFSVQDISLCLGGRQILDHVSFSVDTPGRVIGLLGPNGGGKTTLLRAICGELPHDGHVFLEGAELAGLRSKELARPGQLYSAAERDLYLHECPGRCADGILFKIRTFEPAVRRYEEGRLPCSKTGRNG